MSGKETKHENDLGVRVAGVFLPTLVTAHLLAVWIPKPLAWAVSIFTWNLAVFWVPPRPHLTLRRWLIIVSALSLLAFVLLTVMPNAF